jgi:hypothetical protein
MPSIVLKCKPADIDLSSSAPFYEWPRKRPLISPGDEVFVWLSETADGKGLSRCAIVRSIEARGLTLELRGGSPGTPFGNAQFSPFESEPAGALGGLWRKLYRHSHNKIATLTADEAEVLRRCFGVVRTNAADDISRLQDDPTVGPITRQALIDARLGQGKFREALLLAWGGRCAVSRCGMADLLRASHIKPWSLSDHRERLDPENGLLLVAHLDAMFDAGWIAFSESGELLVSPHWPDGERHLLPSQAGLYRPPSRRQRAFLAYHRSHLFKG